MTTSMTIACTPILLPSEVSYGENSFPKHYVFNETSPYFCERYDATGRAALIALQKCTSHP
jgi:hypothetical protein